MGLILHATRNGAIVKKYIEDGNSNDEVVVIPPTYDGEPVTRIVKNAFFNLKRIKRVILPASLSTIEDFAFMESSVEFVLSEEDNTRSEPKGVMEGVTEIGFGAFAGSNIKRVRLEAKHIGIADSAFRQCSRLESFAAPNCESLDLCGDLIFSNCVNLLTVEARKAKCAIIPESMFENCERLLAVKLDCKRAAKHAFLNCTNLISPPDDLRTFGKDCFEGCLHLLDNNPVIAARLLKEHRRAQSKVQPQNGTTKEGSLLKKQPVFTARIVNMADDTPVDLPETLVASFSRTTTKMYFSVKKPKKSVRLVVDESPETERLLPLFEYLDSSCSDIQIKGCAIGNFYDIVSVQVQNLGTDCWTHPKLLEQCIEQLKKTTAEGGVSDSSDRYYMKTMDEFETYMQIMGDNLPEFVRDCFYRNKAISKDANTSKEYRMHALTALEVMLNIDWNDKVSFSALPSAKEVRDILDHEMYGLAPVKDKLVQQISLLKRSGSAGWGLLIVGPPGSGKTAMAYLVSRILQLKLIELDMSAIGDDPQQISGSPRIFNNAIPGLLAMSMEQNKTPNGILLLNELDKAVSPRNAGVMNTLLSILDKTGLRENFLEETLPTGGLFPIATANSLETLPAWIQDRFFIIEMPEYTYDEKFTILKDFVFARVLERSRISPDNLLITDDCFRSILQYGGEPRKFDQYCEAICGYYSVKEEEVPGLVLQIAERDIGKILGKPSVIHRVIPLMPGQCSSAFVHEGQAHIFMVQASLRPGTGKFDAINLGENQAAYAKAAWIGAATSVKGQNLNALDCTIFCSQPIPETNADCVGASVYAAIISSLVGKSLDLNSILVVGGCDILGNIYNASDRGIATYVEAMKKKNLNTLFCPLGMNNDDDLNLKDITVIESPDGKTMFSLMVQYTI